jgi:hypothetical protein
MLKVKKLIDLNHSDINTPEKLPERYRMLQIKRDIRWFDRYVLKHGVEFVKGFEEEGEKLLRAGKEIPQHMIIMDKRMKLYQLAGAAPLIYLQRKKLQQDIRAWMEDYGEFTPEEIDAFSEPRYEWPEERITKEQQKVLNHWRKKYQIKDDTDWTQGIVLTDEDKEKLDKYKQVAIIQPRQSGKSEVVVRVNIYCLTLITEFDTAVFAPTEKQAKNYIFQRTRDYIEDNPAYKGRFKRLNALDLTLDKERASGSSLLAASASPTANIEGDSLDWAIIDEAQDVTDYKVKKSIKYMMAAKMGSMIKIGTVNTIKGHFWEATNKKGEAFWHQVIIHPDIVAACRPDWAEFIANEIEENGRWSDTVRMSVFLEWLLEVGMFITEEMWESLLDEQLDWVEYDKKGLQYAVIDVAKSKDETICMVLKVDPKAVINGRNPFQLLNAIALHGVDYDSQYETIKSWLDNNYNVSAIGVDDTGGRGGIADRFEKTSYRVEKFTYSQPTKSEWYTNLSTVVNFQHESVKTGQYHERLIKIPASKAARKDKKFRDMEEQMLDLQREFKGKYLKVHHPDIEGAKDDYPDTLMMGAWMASRVMMSVEELEKEVRQAEETQMDKMDWTSDVFGTSSEQKAKRNQRKKKKKAMGENSELAQILAGSMDLDQPDWD